MVIRLKNTLIILLSFFALFASLKAEVNFEIKVNIVGLHYDTLWFGHSYGKKVYPDFYTLRQEDGSFVLKSKEGVKQGYYPILFKPSKESKYNYFHVAITEKEASFAVSCEMRDVFNTIKFENSPQSEVYYLYRNGMLRMWEEYNRLLDVYRIDQDSTSFAQMSAKEKEIIEFQKQMKKEHGGEMIGEVMEITRLLPPLYESGNWQKLRSEREKYYVQLIKNGIPAKNDLFWKLPMCIDWLDHLNFKICDPNPDDALRYALDVLNSLSANEAAYQYYMVYMLNSYSKMSKNNFDKVYVHLVKEYVEKGKTPWLSEEEILKHQKQAANIERLMPGKAAPDVRLYQRDGTPLSISEIVAPYTVLVFWDPECPHCKRELPVIQKLTESYASKGIKVATVCSRREDKINLCWEHIDKEKFPSDWYHLGDGKSFSRFAVLYDVTSFPLLMVLDKNKNIVFRRKGEVLEKELKLVFDKL